MYYPIQPYHLVSISPWPIYVSFDLMILAINLVYYFHNSYSIFFGSNNIVVIFSIINLIYGMILWFRDIIIESSYLGHHTTYIQYGLVLGFYLFLVTEIFFFIGAFWAYFHSSLVPTVEIGNIWPPIGIEGINPFDLPLLNTVLLLSSGISITYAHHYMIGRDRINSIYGFIVTIIFALLFIYCQYIEYSTSNFSINDSVFGTCFYYTTGLHGFHVIIGTLMIIVSFYRLYSYQITNNVHIGIECSIIYWHMVDIIWILVFIFVYWWGY